MAVGNDIHVVVDDGICTLGAIPGQAQSALRMLASTLAKAAFILAISAFTSAKRDAQQALHLSRRVIIQGLGAGCKPSLVQGAESLEPMLKQPLLRGEKGLVPGETAILHRQRQQQQNEPGFGGLLALVGEKGQSNQRP